MEESLINSVQQSDSVFRFLFHSGFYGILNIVPCAIQRVLVVYFI